MNWRRLSTRYDWLIPAATSAVALAVLFAGVPYSLGYGLRPSSLFRQTWSMWMAYPEWGHGLLVIPLAAFLVYLKRNDLKQIPIRGSWWGLPVLILAIALFWAGFITDLQYAGYAALQLFTAGLVIWFLGTRFFGAVFFIWLFLSFAWPLVFLDQYVAFPLRLLMSSASAHALNLLGIATIRAGTAILSGPDPAAGVVTGQRFSVDVADPCSGLHSLFALTMVSALYGIAVFRRWWQVLVLVLAAFPLAIFGNFCRIILLTFGTISFGSRFALGSEEHPAWFHSAAGFFVYGVALAGLQLLGIALSRLSAKPSAAD
ncbi:MAG: exosortase/archaeosortase family protein [Verrucomicrobia bacterium]|nr:exosortase/archaeosortase family protein [Verrucomicrobiota bacterium]